MLLRRRLGTLWSANSAITVLITTGLEVTTIDQTEARLNTHEEICALRYDSICARLKRLEGLGLTAVGAIITLLIGILLTMLGVK